MRRAFLQGLGPLIKILLVLVLAPVIAYGRAPYPIYFTFNEEMGLRRFLKPGEPGYKDDKYLRMNPELAALPVGAIVEMDSSYNSKSKPKLDYFRKDEKSDRTRFINGFKVLYAPGWSEEQIAAFNTKTADLYLIQSSVWQYKPSREKPEIPAMAAVETQVAPVVTTPAADTATAATEKGIQTPQEAVKIVTPVTPAVRSAPAADPATGAAESTAPVHISTNDKIGMRLKASDETLGAVETYLPKGSVIKIATSNLETGESLDYLGGKGVNRDFVTGIEVVSAPGMSKEEIAALNAKPLYMAQSFVKEGDVIAEPTAANLANAADNADTEAATAGTPDCDGSPECAGAKSTVPVALPTTGSPCDGVPAEAMAGCLKFLGDKDVPDAALLWTLKVYKANLGVLKMNKCVLNPPTDHYSVPDDFHKDDLQRGIQNKCQIMINDTTDKWGAFPLRGTYHFLNLCTGDKRSGYFNMGTGTFSNKYKNEGGKRTTVLGAFLTADAEFLYDPEDRDYRAIKKKWGGAPAVALFGLQNTNNTSANTYKYMHVSPYKSSYGCPSLSPDDRDLIKKLADNGPSLVVNYGPNMEDPSKCTP